MCQRLGRWGGRWGGGVVAVSLTTPGSRHRPDRRHRPARPGSGTFPARSPAPPRPAVHRAGFAVAVAGPGGGFGAVRLRRSGAARRWRWLVPGGSGRLGSLTIPAAAWRSAAERGDVGGLQLVLRRAVVAGDPVARRPPGRRPVPRGRGRQGKQRDESEARTCSGRSWN